MARDRQIKGAGFNLIISTGSVSRLTQAAIKQGLEGSAEIYLRSVRETISLDDHTLQELKRLGYPYGHEGEPIHDSDAEVHIQTGELLAHMTKTQVSEDSSRRFSVRFLNSVPYLKFLLYGTSRMRARPFHIRAYNLVKPQIWKPVRDKLKAINYRTEAPKGSF